MTQYLELSTPGRRRMRGHDKREEEGTEEIEDSSARERQQMERRFDVSEQVRGRVHSYAYPGTTINACVCMDWCLDTPQTDAEQRLQMERRMDILVLPRCFLECI